MAERNDDIDRRSAVAWLVVATVAFAIVTALTVPWSWFPGGDVRPADPTGGLTADQLARAEALRNRSTLVSMAGLAVSLAVALVLGLTRLGATLVRRLPARWWWLRVLLGAAVVLAIGRLCALPFAAWNESSYRDYGLSTQGWADWLLDQATAYGVALVSSAIALLVFIGLARRLRRWWLPGSLLAAALVIVASFVWPVVVAPLFASTTPMEAGPLKRSLLALARADGVTVDDVLVADASQRTTTLNAYVAGFGATKRIVVYDTLVDQGSPDEVRQVVAHELGHSAEDDPLHGTILGALGAAAGVTLLALLVDAGWTRRRSGAAGMADAAVVPLVLALLAAGVFVSGPLNSRISRAIEARADVHSLELTEDPAVFERMQRRLAITNLSDPDPPYLYYLWFSSHPTLPQRLEIARRWTGEAG